MNQLPKTAPIMSAFNFSLEPGSLGEEIQDNRGGAIGSRLLFALQAITSLIALPVLLLLGILETGFYAITCQGEKTKLAARATIAAVLLHSLFVLPFSIIQILFSKNWATKIGEPWQKGTVEIMKVATCQCSDSKKATARG